MAGERTVRGIFIFNGDRGLSEAEVALGTPDIAEARSLEHHVDRCALRYKMFTKRLAVQGDDLNLIKNMLFVLIGFLLITNKEFQSVFNFALEHFKSIF